DNEDTKKPKRKKIKKLNNGLSANENKDQVRKENEENLNCKPDVKKEDEAERMGKEVKDGTDVENDINKNGETANEDVKNDLEEAKNNIGEVKNASDEETTMEVFVELEDGECSDSSEEEEADDDSSSNASTATVSDEDSIAKHHPPCMRVIVRETDLPKLKVGSLYLITKDGGTVGREGEQHTILIKDQNVSRILHGSTIQLGETKLICHIHPGNDTCGHCEPGLLMETEEKEKKTAYTRTCSVKKQHELELARLKNIYAPKLLEIEEKPYNDRAQARRETVGSSHHAVKTESTDLDT
ncbi:Angiogenic factor with G patch and FHA domains 1, partial [Operophtera brumata]